MHLTRHRLRSRVLTIALVSLVLAAQIPAFAAAKINAPCAKVKQRSGSLVCSKVKGKLVWRPAAVKPAPTPTPPIDYSPPSTGKTVDRNGLIGRTLMGYQGWFACSTDDTGPSWVHWFEYDKPPATNWLTVDYWPDTSEYSSGELCPTEMKAENGQTMYAYSGYNQTVLNRHFSWMQKYEIDGVALQRFASRISDTRLYTHDYLLMQRAINAAQRYGRVLYFEYDLSGVSRVADLKKDWIRAVDAGLTDSSSYLHLNGRPLVELWGIGIPGVNNLGAGDIAELIAFFKENPNPKYRAAVAGGVGSHWREGTGDGSPGADWAKVYRSFDVLNPWAVGRYGSKNIQEAQTYLEEVVVGDLAETQRLGILYLPVIWPGFSWTNLMRNRGNSDERNVMPRYCGAFYWQQVVNVIRAGAQQVFIAMFDEVDEGTAMYKMVTSQQGLPRDSQLVPLDIDGCSLNSDFYLRLASATADATRRGITPTRALPLTLQPGEAITAPTFGLDAEGKSVKEFSRGLP